MNTMWHTFACAAPVALWLLVQSTACRAQVTAPLPAGGDGRAAQEKLSGLTIRVAPDKPVYAAGEPINLRLTLRNGGKADLHLTYLNGQRFDFVIRRGAKPVGPPLWQWSKGMMFTMMVMADTLKPGATQTFTATYAPKPDGGKPERLPPGVYNVTGVLAVGRPESRPHGTATFRIK